MELHLNFTHPECLNPFEHAPPIYYYHDRVYHSAVQIVPDNLYNIRDSGTTPHLSDIRLSRDSRKILTFDRHASFLSRQYQRKILKKYLVEPGLG